MPAPEPAPVRACIALGSNLGDREHAIREGLRLIGRIQNTSVERVSPIVETAPVRVGSADPGGAYMNAAALLSTRLPARRLLTELHGVEAALGRDRALQPHGSARTLDLDLLLYGDQVIDEPGIRVPHPRMSERRFVLEPLAAVAGESVVPGLERTVSQLLAALPVHVLAVLTVLCVLCMAPLRAGAQTIDLPAAAALEEAAGVYQKSPTAERITITVRQKRIAAAAKPALTDSRSSDITVRIDPGDKKGPRRRAMQLELGQLRAYASDGLLTVISSTNPETFWQIKYDPALDLTPHRLGQLLQPVPLPGLALVRATAAYENVELVPGIGRVHWNPLRIDPKSQDTTYRLVGQSVSGSVELLMDDVDGQRRLRKLSAVLPAPKGAAAGSEEAPQLELVFTTLPAGDPAAWKIDTTGRTQVKTLRDLTRRTDSMVRQKFPLGSLTTSKGSTQSIADLFEGKLVDDAPVAGAAAPTKPTIVFMILRRPDATHDLASLEPVRVAAITAIDLLTKRLAEAQGDRAKQPGAEPAAPIVISVIDVLVQGAEPAREGLGAYWAPVTLLSRIAPGEPVVIVAVDSGQVIRAVVPVDEEDAPEPSAIADNLGRALFPDLLTPAISTPASPAPPK